MALAMAGAFMGLALLLPAHWRRGFLLPSDHSHLGTLVWWLALWGSLGFLTSGTLVLLVGMWGFPPRAVFLAATILLAGVALWRGIAEWPGLLRVERLPLHDSVFIVALRVVAVGAVGLLAWMTLQPWLEIDTLTYHQSVPKAWLNEGRVFGVPFEAHSHWHFLSDVVNVWSFALLPSDTIAPKLLELIRSLLAACAAAGGAAWLYGRRAGLVTGVMVLLFTEMSRYGTTSHVDVGMGLYATVGVLLLAAWLADPRQLRLAVLGSVILGGCAGAKHTGGVTMLAALVVAALIRTVQMMRQVRRPPASHLLVELVALFLPAFLVVLPWLVKNALFTGNPFYPFLSRHFNIREDAAIPLIHFITYYPDDAPLMERLLPGTSQLAAFNSNAALNNANGYVFMTFAAMLIWFFTRPGNGAVLRPGAVLSISRAPVSIGGDGVRGRAGPSSVAADRVASGAGVCAAGCVGRVSLCPLQHLPELGAARAGTSHGWCDPDACGGGGVLHTPRSRPGHGGSHQSDSWPGRSPAADL
jgi:hypothetical protein